MVKNIRRVNNEINEILKGNQNHYTLNFISLIFTFLLFNLSLITIYNLYDYNQKLKSSYSLNVYINNNVSQNSIEEIEENILNLSEVETVMYESKEIALRKITEKLGVSNNITNPLLNSFTITTKGEKKLIEIHKVVGEFNGVKETVISQKYINSLNEKINRNNRIIYFLFFITFIPVVIIIFNISHCTIISQTHDIQTKFFLGVEKKDIMRPYYFINNIKFISAGIIGTLIFLNIYHFTQSKLLDLNNLTSTIQVSILTGISILILSIVFPLISSSLIKVKE